MYKDSVGNGGINLDGSTLCIQLTLRVSLIQKMGN